MRPAENLQETAMRRFGFKHQMMKGRSTYMVKKIMCDPLFLGQKSEDATEKDK